MIENLEVTPNFITGKVCYDVYYDKRKMEYSCTCPAGSLGKHCRHVAELMKKVENEKKGDLSE